MKIDCNIIQDLLPLFHDAVCSPESRETVVAHLQDCPECRRAWKVYTDDLALKEKPDRDMELAKSAAAAWKRKHRKVVLKRLAVVFAIVLLWWSFFSAPYTQWGMGLTARIWEKQLNQYAAELLGRGIRCEDELASYSVRVYPESGCVYFIYDFFDCKGFYYSVDGTPVGYQGEEVEFIPKNYGWIWRETDGDNWMYTEKIVGNWYWFDMHF